MYWVVHPLQPRDFPRPSRCPSGFALGTSLRPREISRASGDLFPNTSLLSAVYGYNTSRLEAVYGHSLIINPYRGMYQEIHPCMAGSIDSVKINTSLLMMREWMVLNGVGWYWIELYGIGWLKWLHPWMIILKEVGSKSLLPLFKYWREFKGTGKLEIWQWAGAGHTSDGKGWKILKLISNCTDLTCEKKFLQKPNKEIFDKTWFYRNM